MPWADSRAFARSAAAPCCAGFLRIHRAGDRTPQVRLPACVELHVVAVADAGAARGGRRVAAGRRTKAGTRTACRCTDGREIRRAGLANQRPCLPVSGGELGDGLVRRVQLVFERVELRVFVDGPPVAAVLLIGRLSDFPAGGGFLIGRGDLGRGPFVVGTDDATGQQGGEGRSDCDSQGAGRKRPRARDSFKLHAMDSFRTPQCGQWRHCWPGEIMALPEC